MRQLPHNPKPISDGAPVCIPHAVARIILGIVLASFSIFSARVAHSAEKPGLPNIVLIFADDLGYADLGCFGGRGLATPHLDRMAEQGIRLTDFYVAQAVCSASRAALLTGCYPNRVGIQGALGPASRVGLHDQELTIAELLKTTGYRTAIYGKWHLGHLPQFLPTRQGFDEYFGLPYSNDMWPNHPTAKFPDLPLMEGERVVALNPDQSQLTRWYTERAVQRIEEQRPEPFLIYLAHAMPHVPLFASDRFAGQSARGLFGDVISEIDWSVGEILQALARTGQDENTLVIFTSDNGPWLSYGNHAGSAEPFREGKGTAWEGGVRVPFIARWPGKIPAGISSSAPAATIDVLPTLAKLTGATLPTNAIDGRDIWPVLTGAPGAVSPHAALWFYWGQELHAVRSGPWKLHFPHSYRHLKTAGQDGKPGPYKSRQTGLALYNLEQDPGEAHDLSEQQPDVVQQLQRQADHARAQLGDSLKNVPATQAREVGRVP